MQFQHDGKDDAMENDIVFTDEVNQFCVFIIPIRFPLFVVVNGPLPGSAEVADGRSSIFEGVVFCGGWY